MAPKTKKRATPRGGNHQLFPLNFETLNHAIGTIEKQAGWAYKQFKGSLPKNWEKRLEQWTSNDLVRLAMKKRNQIAKEVKHYADGIVTTLHHADILPNKNSLMKEAKKNLEGFIQKIQKSNVAHRAIHLASAKGNQVLSMLNFPTKRDVAKLSQRLGQLEKKLNNLGSRRSASR